MVQNEVSIMGQMLQIWIISYLKKGKEKKKSYLLNMGFKIVGP